MTAHTHRTCVAGCYRCDLSRDEANNALLDDLDAAARRLEHLTGDDRWHHPSTPRAVRIAIDDLADTITRMREG